MKFGVIIFPGSNCDHDTYHALKHAMGQETVFLWHQDTDLQKVDAIIIPGGFSYGDYLRCGAIAKFSPIMGSVHRHARDGKLVLGICNGFQILQEARLLPGVLLRNAGLKFICRHVHLRTENGETPFTTACKKGQILRLPIAHNDGNFFISPDELVQLQENEQIVFRYCDPDGNITPEANPNGSVHSIAAVRNREGNVMALMPHPERASEPLLGSKDGCSIFQSMINQEK
ncbi:phosphoribosylformylglycinamidine synthase subunit PurQ [Acidobacteria bacterium AH-259-L09]|nr:phosphoribosylformylglycinamidine synthase subunit PurQ [Acidobacteria bacterium AH-259-L09]